MCGCFVVVCVLGRTREEGVDCIASIVETLFAPSRAMGIKVAAVDR